VFPRPGLGDILFIPGPIIKIVESKKMKFPTKSKKEIICALFNCGCRGRIEFRREFEAFLCESHLMLAIRKSWSSYE
jgi:hypothetical protein